ncbi:MAG: hypothetical protein LUF83_14185 [Alistipes sp.]|nr:hypothetical protein [Alistipes sp.]
MGQYKYEGWNQRRMANLILYGIPVAWSAYLVFDYACADSGSGFTGLFPPEMRLYVLVISLALVIGGAYAGAWRILSGPKIEGDIWIEGGRLQMTVLRGNRMEPVDLEIRELTFVENDEERMRVVSSKGEYILNSSNFVSADVYEKFQSEMTCEKYKK